MGTPTTAKVAEVNWSASAGRSAAPTAAAACRGSSCATECSTAATAVMRQDATASTSRSKPLAPSHPEDRCSGSSLAP